LYVKYIGIYGGAGSLYQFSTVSAQGFLTLTAAQIQFYFNATSAITLNNIFAVGEPFEIEVYYNATTGIRYIKLNGIDKITSLGVAPVAYTVTAANTITRINSNYNNTVVSPNKLIRVTAAVNGVTIADIIGNHGQAAVLYNLANTALNYTITGAVLATFWGSNSNDAIPYDVTLGATLYRKDSDLTIMPICFDTSQVITGFTRLGYFAPASGILKGLPNTYNISNVAGIVDGDYTADQIAAFVESEFIDITQDANTVSLLKVRKR